MKKVVALILSLVMVLSMLPVTTMAATSIAYNGYPYATATSTSQVTLTIEATGATSYQWQMATAQGGAYTDVCGEAPCTCTSTYTFEPAEGAWYRCVVDGVASEAVQTIQANSPTFLNASHAQWYIGNGTMAYTLLYGAAYFDIVGKYTKGSVTYWMNTSYNGYWDFGSSSNPSPTTSYSNSQTGIEYIRLYFSDDPRSVNIDVQLASGQTAFAVGTDTMLGTGSVTSYADNASLKAILKENKLSQVQMVGAKSLDVALESDPAFVLRPITQTDCFWIGRYGQDHDTGDAYDGVAYMHNFGDPSATSEYPGYNSLYTFTTLGEKSVVTEIKEDDNPHNSSADSAMTVSWMNLTDRATDVGPLVQFQFSVGSVADTGAQIAISATSKVITIADASSDYYYALYKKDGTLVKPWTNTIPAGGLVFDGLEADTEYVVKAIAATFYDSNATEQNESKVTKKDITTAIDPFKPDASAPTATPVVMPSTNAITFNNLNTSYSYTLLDENGNVASVEGYKEPDEDGVLIFADLEAGTKYYLVAKTDDNDNSDRIEVTTLADTGNDPVTPPQPPVYYPPVDPTPVIPSVDVDIHDDTLSDAAKAVGSAVKSGAADITPVGNYTKESIAQIQKDDGLKLVVEKKTDYDPAEKALIDKAAEERGKSSVVQVLEIEVTLRTKNNEIVAVVNDTIEPLTITVELNEEMQKAAKEGKTIYVARAHEGKVTFIEGTLNADKTEITFDSSLFSTYALVAFDSVDSPQTFDAGIMLPVVVTVLGTTGSAWLLKKKED